jgi:hypothetical protein
LFVRAEPGVDLRGVRAAYDDRGPKGLKFLRPAITDLLHLQQQGFLSPGKEFDVLSFVEGADKQGVSGVILPLISGFKQQIGIRIETSGVLG